MHRSVTILDNLFVFGTDHLSWRPCHNIIIMIIIIIIIIIIP